MVQEVPQYLHPSEEQSVQHTGAITVKVLARTDSLLVGVRITDDSGHQTGQSLVEHVVTVCGSDGEQL